MTKQQKTAIATAIACGGPSAIEKMIAKLENCGLNNLVESTKQFAQQILPLYKKRFDGFLPKAVIQQINN